MDKSFKKCQKGEIMRKGYTRHINQKTIRVPKTTNRRGYIRNINEKTIKVKPNCIKSQSDSGIKRSIEDEKTIKRKNIIHNFFEKIFKKPRCEKNEVLREGYIKKSYTRKNGIKVGPSVVKPGCIKASGLTKKTHKKGKQLFVLKRGELTKYGYSGSVSENIRHNALKKALKDIKPISVFRKLIALYVLNKNKNPKLARIFKSDAEWVKTTKEYENRDI